MLVLYTRGLNSPYAIPSVYADAKYVHSHISSV